MRKKTLADIRQHSKRQGKKSVRPARSARSAPVAPVSASIPDPLGERPERMRTSFYLDHRVVMRAKQMSRMKGISLNAYVTIALADRFHRDTFEMAPPSSPMPIPASIPAPARDRAQDRKADKLAAFLKKHGDGVTLSSEEPGEPPAFATWEQVARFAQEQRKDLEADWVTIGKRCQFDMETARAADYGQSLPQLDTWWELAHG